MQWERNKEKRASVPSFYFLSLPKMQTRLPMKKLIILSAFVLSAVAIATILRRIEEEEELDWEEAGRVVLPKEKI